MSALLVELGAGALWSGGFGISAWLTHRNRSPKADLKRADRFARQMDLYLPQELVSQVAARLRRRLVFGLTLMGLLLGSFLAYLSGVFMAIQDDTSVYRIDIQAVPFPGPAGAGIGLASGILIATLEGVWDLARAGREAATTAGPRTRPAMPAQLQHAVPLWLIRAARVLAVLPALVAAGACAAQGRAGLALGFLALTPLCCLVAWSMERLQLWMLNTERLAGRDGLLPQQAAFDDALRVTAALPLLLLAPIVCIFAGAFYIHLVGRGSWYQGLMLAWALALIPTVGLNMLLNTDRVKRYHHSGARSRPAPAPASS